MEKLIIEELSSKGKAAIKAMEAVPDLKERALIAKYQYEKAVTEIVELSKAMGVTMPTVTVETIKENVEDAKKCIPKRFKKKDTPDYSDKIVVLGDTGDGENEIVWIEKQNDHKYVGQVKLSGRVHNFTFHNMLHLPTVYDADADNTKVARKMFEGYLKKDNFSLFSLTDLESPNHPSRVLFDGCNKVWKSADHDYKFMGYCDGFAFVCHGNKEDVTARITVKHSSKIFDDSKFGYPTKDVKEKIKQLILAVEKQYKNAVEEEEAKKAEEAKKDRKRPRKTGRKKEKVVVQKLEEDAIEDMNEEQIEAAMDKVFI